MPHAHNPPCEFWKNFNDLLSINMTILRLHPPLKNYALTLPESNDLDCGEKFHAFIYVR